MLATLGLQIREFVATDAGFVSRLGKLAFWEFADEPGVSTLWMAKRHTTLVATFDGVPVGFAIVQLDAADRIFDLLAIAVMKSRRSRGVGRRLLKAVEGLALAQHAPELRLHTADFNLAALDLFLKNGFRIQRRYPRYYRNRFDACELVKRL